jgi:hypothetical protein
MFILTFNSVLHAISVVKSHDKNNISRRNFCEYISSSVYSGRSFKSGVWCETASYRILRACVNSLFSSICIYSWLVWKLFTSGLNSGGGKKEYMYFIFPAVSFTVRITRCATLLAKYIVACRSVARQRWRKKQIYN